MHQIIIFPPYVLLAERSKPSTYTPICNIIRYCVAFSAVCIKPCVSNWRTESICWLHLMTGMKFKVGEQIWWQRMSAYVADVDEMLIVQRDMGVWFLSLTVTHRDLTRSEQESVTWVQTGLLHYWLRAICWYLEGLAERRRRKASLGGD